MGVIAPWFLGVGVLVSFTAAADQNSADDWNVAPLTARLAGAGRPLAFGAPLTGDIGLYGQGLPLVQTARLAVGEPGDFPSLSDEREPHLELKPSAQNFPQVDRTRKGDPVVEMRPSFESRFVAPDQLSFRVDGATTRVGLAPRAPLPSGGASAKAAGLSPDAAQETAAPIDVAPATPAADASIVSPAQVESQVSPAPGASIVAPTQDAATPAPETSDDAEERAAQGATPAVARAVELGSSTPAQPDAVPIEVSAFPAATLALAPQDGAAAGAQPDYAAMIDPERMDREKRCLAEAVYFEARSEPEAGQAAVAQVVLNRVQSGLYPGSVCGVVYQNRHRFHACQFSFACEGKSLRITERESWEQAVRVADEVMDGRTYLSDVGRSTHYHANYVKPRWARSLTKMDVIGRHIFYKLKPGQT
jgi:hypothetical protein